MGSIVVQKSVHRLDFRKSSAPVQQLDVHPVYTIYTQSEASVVWCSTNQTCGKILTKDFK